MSVDPATSATITALPVRLVRVLRSAARDLRMLASRHGELVWELTKRDVRDRYAGQVLGVLWAVGHPLFLMALYVTVFAYIFPARLEGRIPIPRDFTVYILAGLIPWITFQEVLSRASTCIVNSAGLVKQIVFPVEVLPIKTVLGSSLGQLVSTTALCAYLLLTDNDFSITFALILVLWFFQLLAMIGIGYILAAVGVYIKDIKDFVVVFSAANFFLQPVIYSPEAVPKAMQYFFYLNPFSYMTWCYQDAIYFGSIEHPVAWVVFAGGSICLAAGGYALFRKLAPAFGNVL